MASTAQKKAATSTRTKTKGSKKTAGSSGSKTRKARSDQPAWESRAVPRLIEPGSVAECPHCGERVKFRARHRDQQVICNVYEDGVWQRVEQYHLTCYEAAGSPHGEAVKS